MSSATGGRCARGGACTSSPPPSPLLSSQKAIASLSLTWLSPMVWVKVVMGLSLKGGVSEGGDKAKTMAVRELKSCGPKSEDGCGAMKVVWACLVARDEAMLEGLPLADVITVQSAPNGRLVRGAVAVELPQPV